ncbi:hypothetical protein QJQ45_009674 [Haematococcus lacustris]|nr:hypothetical protein QJQ45_009674 [Haematococcus lacustris]
MPHAGSSAQPLLSCPAVHTTLPADARQPPLPCSSLPTSPAAAAAGSQHSTGGSSGEAPGSEEGELSEEAEQTNRLTRWPGPGPPGHAVRRARLSHEHCAGTSPAHHHAVAQPKARKHRPQLPGPGSWPSTGSGHTYDMDGAVGLHSPAGRPLRVGSGCVESMQLHHHIGSPRAGVDRSLPLPQQTGSLGGGHSRRGMGGSQEVLGAAGSPLWDREREHGRNRDRDVLMVHDREREREGGGRSRGLEQDTDRGRERGGGGIRGVIKVPEGAVLRGRKTTKRKLRAHLQLRAEVHTQLRVIASLFVLRIFLTCLVGYPSPGYRSALEPPAVQPPKPLMHLPYTHSPHAPLPSLPLPSLPAWSQTVTMTLSQTVNLGRSHSLTQSRSQGLSQSGSPPQGSSAHLAALAPAAPSGPPVPLDCEDPVMLRQLKEFCEFYANPNFKAVYNQLQRRLVRAKQRRHPMLMPVFEDPSNQALLAKLQELGNINLIGDADTIDAHSMQLAVAMQQHFANPGNQSQNLSQSRSPPQGAQGPQGPRGERFVKLYAKAARARLGWSGEEAQLFIKMACGYGINAQSSEPQAVNLDKGLVADLVQEANKHHCLLGMKQQGSLQDTLPLPCRMRHAVHVYRCLEQWQQPPTLPVPGQPKRGKRRGQLGLTKESRAAFTSEPALSQHWARLFDTKKLRNKEFAFKRTVDTDGVGVCVHYTRPLPPPPAPPPAASSNSSNSRPSAASAAAHAVGLPHIGRGVPETREYLFDPDTQIGVGIDPGVTQAVSAASGVWDVRSGLLVADQLARWKLTKGQVMHASGLNIARRDTERWLAPIKPHLQHFAAASSAGTSLVANLKHITVTLATWDAVWEVYLDPKWARQRLRLYGAQDRALEQFFKKARLEEDMAEVSMKRHGHAKQLAVFFGAASIGTQGGPRGACQCRGRVVLVDEHRTSRVSSAVNGKQPCEEELNTLTKRSKRMEAGQAAEPTQPTKGKGKGEGKPAPQPGRWLDRDCNAALNMQRIGESKWRPLELCYWPEQGKLPAKGKEYPGLGYKRLRDKPPKAQEQQPAWHSSWLLVATIGPAQMEALVRDEGAGDTGGRRGWARVGD